MAIVQVHPRDPTWYAIARVIPTCTGQQLIPGHNGQLTIVANVEELWVVFQLLLLAFVVV